MKLKALCEAFCTGIAVTEVPIGYAIRTPFIGNDGDALGLYVRRFGSETSLYRVEDDGQTIVSLEENGVDLDNEVRFEELTRLLREYECQFDEAEFLLHTEYVEEERIPALFLKFIGLLLRVQDLVLLAQSKVRNTFLADLKEMVEVNFSDRAEVEFSAQVDINLKDYFADIVIHAPNGKALAIYAATSEVKALESLLIAAKIKEERLSKIKSMLVLETGKPQQIKARTLSRVMNSEVQLAAMDGTVQEITQKMAESVSLH
ncbi:DUF1828 domain-containing protein [uncultured Sneathiella sp.]|jgi:hypothetical protein|uniref:DUF1828 domain-containing protein n=1 Tax=uncultured Sneathiella sp. TaxID=879315 RepID=UPI0030D8A4C8|tara:strand:- start:363 stop:1145 length:783 start_codon:yes stop_codon:yes gene_type:complete